MPTNSQQPTIYGNRAFVFIVDLTHSDSDNESSSRRRRQPEVIDLTNEETDRVLGDITSVIRPSRNRRVRPRPSNSEEREGNKENQPPPTNGSGLQKNEMEAYCVKCRRKEPMVDAKEMTTKNGRKAMSGKCAICSTKMMKFMKK
jgi:hypothetical protein